MTTLATVIGRGAIGSRPAAASAGRLYFSTEPKTYRDNGSSWDDVSDAGSSPSGSITASGYTQTTARLLGRTTASTGAIEEITVGTGLSLSAGSLTATGGGGGAVRTIYGYTTLGGTDETMTLQRVNLKKFSASADGIALGLKLYIKETTDSVGTIQSALYADNAGAIGNMISIGRPAIIAPTKNVSFASDFRWLSLPFGPAELVNGTDYWMAWMVMAELGGTPQFSIKYDAGSDRKYDSGGNFMVDGGRYTDSDTTRKYTAALVSINAS